MLLADSPNPLLESLYLTLSHSISLYLSITFLCLVSDALCACTHVLIIRVFRHLRHNFHVIGAVGLSLMRRHTGKITQIVGEYLEVLI